MLSQEGSVKAGVEMKRISQLVDDRAVVRFRPQEFAGIGAARVERIIVQIMGPVHLF